LHLCGVGPGDEVITTPMTCSATNTHIVLRGATPVWADVDPITGLIDPFDCYDKCTEKTKAIIAVDWAGRSCDYDKLTTMFAVPVIQDAAHNPYGRGGNYTCYSFQAIKHLTTGDGGALVVPPDQYDRARLLRWYGLDRTQGESFRCSQNIQQPGFKYHMNDIAAAIGLGNLPELRRIVDAHRDNAAYYTRNLAGLPGVTVPPSDPESSWWLYTLLVDDRDSCIAHMAQAGIECSPVHSRNDSHDAFHFPNGPLPGVDSFAAHEVAIPVGWWCGYEERASIVSEVQAWSYTHARVLA
jgi:dTDP-4-amino-4,6-dideoxygalactose transaminase